ncbi:mannose-1-phosphate guanylyltransferase/mannose-6-phosphate isomerase [Phaeovulum sp.]|uniref:mannose-1-phosphate guanylyltransferase/mannose-6-phosphate isomerase n=1 Tax=Phaeovulum sp. TaxID=2934796 RepID=UPI0039E2C083
MIHPVILCGGSGTRLWPSSRSAFPKQFAAFLGDRSLYQDTLQRVSGHGYAAPIVLTNEVFRFLAQEQANDIGVMDAEVILEPTILDTGPAILTAALKLEGVPDDLMLVLPSDHLIRSNEAFDAAVQAGEVAANAGMLVAFGVTPDRPETGYGYLELTQPPMQGCATPLASFSEKPDLDSAKEMIKSENFLWNTGMYLFRVGDILAAYQRHAADLIAPCRAALAAGEHDLGFFRLGVKDYAQAEAISIDYAVMEKADNVVAVPFMADWLDLGSWDTLHAFLATGTDQVARSGNVTAIDCTRTLLRSEDENMHLVGMGLDNIAAVAMRDAVLVVNMDRAQDVRQVVQVLKHGTVAQASEFPRCYRPWGWYETLCLRDRFQVKRIMVKPGGVLSLQSHVHRAEHWVVVSGTARVTVNDDVSLLSENESAYIPLGAIHRMENPGKVPMYLIEVQTGAYLGEDDIVRYADIYNRAPAQ